MDYLSNLNEAQRKAVEHFNGPSMVIAGAGSGKTRVLTYRIAHLIKKGVDPFCILALTFTNKASREMKERIIKIVGNADAQNLWMGTFHAVCARILRSEAEKLGYPSNFTIYDTADSKNLIKSIVKELQLDDKTYKPGLVYNRISMAKNSLISATAYLGDIIRVSEDTQSLKPHLGEIYRIYEKRCFKAGAMDFDDLLFKTNILLNNFPETLHKYQHRFNYVLVDEFQDTNYSQYLIVKRLSAINENICVVGDDAQSIYGFRGASIENILNFQKDYPDTKIFKLEQNYRSTKNIVNVANSVIAKNKQQLHKEVWTNNQEGDKIPIIKTLTDNEEGLTVANTIFEIRANEQAMNKDFAILYRTNAQSRSMEEALRRLNIPYRIYGGLSFYQRKEIKDLLAYFRLTLNHHDEESLKRIINYPARGIGKTTLYKIIVKANETGNSLWDVLAQTDKFQIKVNSGTQSKIEDFVITIKSFATLLNKENAYTVAENIAKSSGILKELYNDKSPEGVSRYENIQELLNGIKEFTISYAYQETDDGTVIENQEIKSLGEYLQDIALLTDVDHEDKNKNDKVFLMTIHAAKGLEFPYVFIVGMEENLFPSQLSINSRSDLEEERRLFYVALTRAMKKVTISYAASRYKWGDLNYCEPSRFIDELDKRYIIEPYSQQNTSTPFATSQQNRFVKKKPSPKPLIAPARNFVKLSKTNNVTTFVSDDTQQLQTGMEVEHQIFGKGKVINLEGVFPNNKATIFFPNFGQKQLLLKFAKLKIV